MAARKPKAKPKRKLSAKEAARYDEELLELLVEGMSETEIVTHMARQYAPPPPEAFLRARLKHLDKVTPDQDILERQFRLLYMRSKTAGIFQPALGALRELQRISEKRAEARAVRVPEGGLQTMDDVKELLTRCLDAVATGTISVSKGHAMAQLLGSLTKTADFTGSEDENDPYFTTKDMTLEEAGAKTIDLLSRPPGEK